MTAHHATKMRAFRAQIVHAGFVTGIAAVLGVWVVLPGCTAQRNDVYVSSFRAAAEGNRKFATQLFGKLRGQAGNLFFSPFSISTALAMAYSGARGQTAEQMAAVLYLPTEQGRTHSGFGALIKELHLDSQAGGYQLNIANGLWGQKGYAFLPSFVDMLRTDYGADVNEVDFVHQPEEARAALNSWVEHRTQGKIKDLFPQGALDSKTRLVLANAIYFKGKWSSQFKSAETHDAPFTAPTKQKISVATMHQVGCFQYLDNDSFQALEMPYQGGKLAMDVFLPRKVDGLPEFERVVTAEKLVEWIAKLQLQTVWVALPKFKMTSAFELNNALAGMGMPLAFSAGADFTGMSERGKELFLSKVVHKAYVEVNEEGTEAAAATGEAVSKAVTIMPRPIDFRADHPFFFLIRDIGSGTVLFMGRMENPR